MGRSFLHNAEAAAVCLSERDPVVAKWLAIDRALKRRRRQNDAWHQPLGGVGKSLKGGSVVNEAVREAVNTP